MSAASYRNLRERRVILLAGSISHRSALGNAFIGSLGRGTREIETSKRWGARFIPRRFCSPSGTVSDSGRDCKDNFPFEEVIVGLLFVA